jgi:hypothetical protein
MKINNTSAIPLSLSLSLLSLPPHSLSNKKTKSPPPEKREVKMQIKRK